jgi:hypothetical protein
VTDELVGYFGSLLTGGMLGYIAGRLTNSADVTQENIQHFMRKVVNAEEADERFNLTRKMLHDANRRTMPRADATEPAKVYRMRKRKRVRYGPTNSQP